MQGENVERLRKNHPLGHLERAAQKDGYVAMKKDVTVIEGKVNAVSFTLEPRVPATVTSISGVVKNTEGVALKDVTISTIPVSETVFTDKNGIFTIDNGIDGSVYTVIAQKNGYWNGEKEIAISKGKVNTVSFALDIQAPVTVTSISGIVKNSAGEFLKDVTISTVPATEITSTNEDGTYMINTGVMPGVTYTITAQKIGYNDAEKEITTETGQTFTVDFVLNPELPIISIEPQQLDFSHNIDSLQLIISNKGNSVLNYEIESPAVSWLTIEDNLSGSILDSSTIITVNIDRSKAAHFGDLYTNIYISSNGGDATVEVNAYNVNTADPVLSVDKSTIDFGVDKNLKSLTISNTGGGTLVWSAFIGVDWVTVSPANGSISTENKAALEVTVNRDLGYGVHETEIEIVSNGEGANGGLEIVTIMMNIQDPCSGKSCNGNGTCAMETGKCLCNDGFDGDDCEFEKCYAESCSQGKGECFDNTGVVVCDCHDGYSGDYCENCADGYFKDYDGTCLNGGLQHFTVPPTGSDICQDLTTTLSACPAQGEAFYGQDAQYSGLNKVLHITTVGDEDIAEDVLTGIVWQVNVADTLRTWQESMDYCANLEYANASDWRLPTIHELMSIATHAGGNVVLMEEVYPEWSEYDFWTFNRSTATTVDAWSINSDADIEEHDESELLRARCVRKNSAYPKTDTRYAVKTELNFPDDEVVVDNITQLMWKNSDWDSPEFNSNWEGSLSICENLNYAGYDDWRLPNINELVSLLDYSAEEGNSSFPDIQISTFNSSTPGETVPFCTNYHLIGEEYICETGVDYDIAVMKLSFVQGRWYTFDDNICSDADICDKDYEYAYAKTMEAWTLCVR